MLAVSPQTAIYLAVKPVDFRCGIDGLAQRCRSVIGQDPLSGAVFVFRNRSKTAIKLLTYDGQGYWLCQKRWSTGKLKWWPDTALPNPRLLPRELSILLHNGNPQAAAMANDWHPVGHR